MGEYYRLNDDHSVTPIDMWEWGEDMKKRRADFDPWRVARTDLENRYWVSTVFLGLDHNYGDGPPLLFETMVFQGDGFVDEYCERCSTWDEAVVMHAEVVEKFR